MTTNEIISYFTAVTGFGFGIAQYISKNKTDNRAEIDFIKDSSIELYKLTKEELKELEQKLKAKDSTIAEKEEALKRERQEKKALEHFTAFAKENIDAFSIPAWYKRWDKDRQVFIMALLNDEYTKVFKKTKAQYLERTDIEVWGETVGKRFEQNDLEFLSGRIASVFNEEIEDPQTGEKIFTDWLYFKLGVFNKAGELEGVVGFAMNIKTDLQNIFKQMFKINE